METIINALHHLAEAAGLARHWRDVEGADRTTEDAVLAAVLGALGFPADSEVQIKHSLERIAADQASAPQICVGEVDLPLAVPWADAPAELIDEAGNGQVLSIEQGMLPPVANPGYYRLVGKQGVLKLAIAPRACPAPHSRSKRVWGPVVQVPSLRGERNAPFGHFGDLRDAVALLGEQGADMVAISPVHALFPGTGDDFSPYSPSSRLFLNGALADPTLLALPELKGASGNTAIDWQAAMPERLSALRVQFENLDPGERARIMADCAAQGPALHRHALFDALDLHFRPHGASGWPDWPASFHSPDSPAVATFARENRNEVEFHMFVQWLARGSLDKVQDCARAQGMALGLIADLAVGVRPGGSDAWAMQTAMLNGLTIGAPPDPLGPLGQNWGLTTYSPQGLAAQGYAPWIAMLRAAFAYAGGIRIDHAYGLARLWVIPPGGVPGEGCYLRYPFLDLVRLATLEAHRAGGVIIAEDLGTAPPGFSSAIAARAMLGMRVLWFERAADHGFIGAHDYPSLSVAMTGTHDTATIAGWWQGRDLEWADQLGRLPDDIGLHTAQDIRAWDRGLLWSTIGDGSERPAPHESDAVVDAAIQHVARSHSTMVAVPLEDLAGVAEQVNLPGTIGAHPNWRHRFPETVAELLGKPDVRKRIALLNANVHGWWS